MTAIPKPEKITAEEYFKLTADTEERTELIGGEIVAMAQPNRQHHRIGYRLFSIIDSYIRANHGTCEVDGEIDVILNEENVVVPDISVICDPAKLDEHGCHGAPDWVIEVTSTNRENDFSRKLYLYRDSGVREYWIIDTRDKKVIVYDFEHHPNAIALYGWDEPVPVRIYGGALTTRIDTLI